MYFIFTYKRVKCGFNFSVNK